MFYFRLVVNILNIESILSICVSPVTNHIIEKLFTKVFHHSLILLWLMILSFLYLLLVANTSNQDWGFWKKIKYCFHDFNLFPSVPPSTNKCELGIQRTSTILFLILLIALLIIPFFFYPFGTGTTSFQTVFFMHPSLSTYKELHSKYPLTLTCTCSQVAIDYQAFIRIEYTLHQVCNSIFITDEWISHLSGSNGATLNGDDFRVTGPYAFQALRMFCELSDKALLDSLFRFCSSQYVGISVMPETLFQTQIGLIIDQFRSSSMNSFLLSLSMIRGTTQANALASGLQTNYRLYNENDDNRVLIAAKNYDGCSCDRSANCSQQSSIYNYISATRLFDVPGFYTGCSVIESLLQSTLQCFHNQTCIDILQTYLPSSSIHVPPLDSSPDIYSKNSTIKILLDQLMVQKWNITTAYERYYHQCQPAQCTYSIDARETKIDAIYIAIVILFLLGGPLFVLKLVVSLLTKIVICCTKKSARQVVPETLIVHT